MYCTVIFDECAKRPTIKEGTRGSTQLWLLKQDTGNWRVWMKVTNQGEYGVGGPQSEVAVDYFDSKDQQWRNDRTVKNAEELGVL